MYWPRCVPLRRPIRRPAIDRAQGLRPVAYFTLSTPTPGVAEYAYVHDGVRYFFANARHRDLFKANPDKCAPQFGGACANNMANGQRRESDSTVWIIIGDKLYVFAGAAGADASARTRRPPRSRRQRTGRR